MTNWCEVEHAQTDWQRVRAPCSGLIEWGSEKAGWGSDQRTDIDMCYISLWDIKPAGEFSKFHLSTQTSEGIPKTIGGDSWRVRVSGPEVATAHVEDLQNGTYQVMFLVTVPGQYLVKAMLEFSICEGLVEPPVDWFIKGNLLVLA